MVIARTSNLLRRITTPLIISCLLTVGLCVNTATALPGSGTQQDPWRIESLADFDEFAADPNYWSGFTRLETDVNLAGRTYTTGVIAPDTNNSTGWYQGTAFTGVFHGNGRKITNLSINDEGAGNWYLALFGCIGVDGQVSNLGIEGGSVSGRFYAAGLVGRNSGSLLYCYSTGDVNGVGSVGGLVGDNYGSVSNCYSTGDVNGVSGVGGLMGGNGGSVSHCYSTGDVSGVGTNIWDGSSGGLVGDNGGLISKCYSTGDVNSVVSVGGLVGRNWSCGSISNCYSTADVNGVSDVGGLAGGNGSVPGAVPPDYGGDIINSYSTGSVRGDYSVGGLVGGNSGGSISNCYSTGDVNGVSGVGGLVGRNGAGRPMEYPIPGYISNSYSTGGVEGTLNVGGLVGYSAVGAIDISFWDVEASGEPNMCGGQGWFWGCDPNCGKTTAEMKTKSTFTEAGWDFVEIWLINDAATYPVLRQEIRSNLNGNGGVDLPDFAIFADHWLEGTAD